MKKISIVIAISTLIIGGSVIGFAYNSNKVNVQHVSLDLANRKSNLEGVVADSELIVKGKINKVTPIKLHEMIFTDYEIAVSEVLKGTSQSVVVRLTGGTLGGNQLIADGIKQLDNDEEYIFCLEKVFPEDSTSDVFSPIGAAQGIFSIDDLHNGKVKIKAFNEFNIVEKGIKGKELDKESDFK